MTTPHLQHSSGLHPNLQKLYDRSCVWDCKLLFEEVDKKTGETTMQHDLCAMRAKGVDYMFPAKYHGLAAKEELLINLKLAALKAGFCLVTDGYEGKKRLNTTKKNCRDRVRALGIYLKCDHGQVHRNEIRKGSKTNHGHTNVCASESRELHPKPKSQKNTSARRPLTRDRVCPFRLTIYMIREDSVVDAGRWFLARVRETNIPNSARHSGHIQIAPDLLPKQIKTMSEEEKKLARECSQLHFTSTSTASLLNIRNALGGKFHKDLGYDALAAT
ncbi:hypothetical protein IV203_006540 [Nitzschia inconspicua]|uniref:Uncharacterized protein n=1 Tax=Nitzschia inconspicua TaxID=303405 RepID=A0A9K3PAX8_9STRA|nr:hypothetical protein IV203_006540 [Nitzschia inconspicua]